MKVNRRLLVFCLVWLILPFTEVQAAYAHAPSNSEAVHFSSETAPLPPPTPTADVGAAMSAVLDEPFTLHIGEWATIHDTPEELGVQVAALVSDSRCPARVNCVVAGQVEFMLQVRMGHVVHRQLFPIGTYPMNDGNKVRYGGYAIELSKVEPPAPPPDERLEPSQYEATLIVRVDERATPEPTTIPTATPAPQADQGDEETPALNQPFTLQVGETADLPDVNFKIILRSLTDDSGCLTADDCSLMLAEGTLVLQRGNDREVLTFNASFTPEQPFTYDFAGYAVQLVHLEQGRDGNQVATFVVKKPTPTVEIPAPQRVARCPLFSRFDAAAILQEDVQQEAIANLVFGPLPTEATAAAGFCGYVTTAFSDARQIDEQAPALLSEVAADRVVAVAEIAGSDVTRLLQLANLVAAADPEAQRETLLRLQTQLAAGNSEGFIRDVTTIAEAMPAFTVSPIQGIGDEGVWLWQPIDNGYFALFLIRDEQRFRVVTALLHEEADELTVLDYAVLMVRRQEQATINEAAPTPQVPPAAPVGDCDLLTLSEAAIILGEEVHEPVAVTSEDGSCLYVPRSEKALTPEEAAISQPVHGVMTQRVTGAAVSEQLTSLAEEVKADNPNADAGIFAIIQSQLMAGDTEGALTLLPKLAEGAESWVIESVPTLDKSLLWLWFTDENHAYSALVGAGDDGALTLIIASLPVDSDQANVRAAFYAVISDWVE